MYILVTEIEGQLYGLDLACVERGVLAVAVTPLPNGPAYLLGAMNLHGHVIPTVNTRKLLGLPPREVQSTDYFIICHVGQQQFALWVDQVVQVRFCVEETLIPADAVSADLPLVQYVVQESSKLIFILDKDRVLSAIAPAPTAS